MPTESGFGMGVLFSTLLDLPVGMAITSQTLRTLGVSVAALRAVVLEQSFWIGRAGLGVTAVAAPSPLGAWTAEAHQPRRPP